jgi:hypothetical protein
MADDLDTAGAVRDYLAGGDVATRARRAVSDAVGANGDLEAELRRVSERTGIPLSSARAMPDEARRRAAAAGDFETMAERFPSTMGFLADPANARLAHDDASTLTGIETVLRETAWAARQVTGGIPAAAQGVNALGQAAGELAAPLLDPLVGTILPENPLRRMAAGFGELRQQAGALTKETQGPLPADAGVIRRGVQAGFQSIGQQAPGLAATILTGNPAFMVRYAGAATGGARFKVRGVQA